MSVCIKYTRKFDLRFCLSASQIQIVHQQIISVRHCKEIFNGIYAFECGDVVNTIPTINCEIAVLRCMTVIVIAVFYARNRNAFREYLAVGNDDEIFAFVHFVNRVAVCIVETDVHAVARVFVFAHCHRRIRQVYILIYRVFDVHARIDFLVDFNAVYNVVHSVYCKRAKSRRGGHKFDDCAFDSIAANDRRFLSVDVNASEFDFRTVCKIYAQIEFFTEFDNIVVEQ